jgi:hypothetical protein
MLSRNLGKNYKPMLYSYNNPEEGRPKSTAKDTRNLARNALTNSRNLRNLRPWSVSFHFPVEIPSLRAEIMLCNILRK